MATISLRDNTIHTSGSLPTVGSPAPDFTLVALDLTRKSLKDYTGTTLILNIFPSVDTGTCAASVRNFNLRAANLPNANVLCVSRDLPFAQKRFCGAEGISKVEMLSDFVNGQFGRDYGLEMLDGNLAALHSRCIVVIDAQGKVVYTEQVQDIANEPDYETALAHI